MDRERILVVDDEADIVEVVSYNLRKEGFLVSAAANGRQALERVAGKAPELIILDWMMPEMDGLQVCRRLKADPKTAAIPIILLTARGAEADIIAGLEAGAEDYVVKPFSPRVLCARVQAVLRRKRENYLDTASRLTVHDLVIEPGRHVALCAGVELALSATEFRLLHFLARRPGWVFTRRQIVEGVQGDDYPVTERAVDVQVVGLRKKLGERADYVETIRGVGYRFKE